MGSDSMTQPTDKDMEHWCWKCKEAKPSASFRKNKTKAHGISDTCKPCMSEIDRAYRARADVVLRQRENHRAQRISPTSRGKVLERDKRNALKSRARFPEKALARSALKRAIDNGMITIPSECQSCGTIPKKGADGRRGIHGHHHNGYSNPLDVIWVCVQCHADEHAKERARGSEK